MAELSKGDKVSWKTPQGTTHGTVVDTRTKDFQLDGRTFHASDDEPYVVVESESGKRAAHKMSSVRQR